MSGDAGGDLDRDREFGRVTVGQAAQVVSALNHAAAVEGDGPAKVRELLRQLQSLLGYAADVEVILYEQIDREPGPLVAQRVWAGPTFERIEPRSDEAVQAALDVGGAMWDQFRRQLERRRPAPLVMVYSEDSGEAGWFEELRDRHLRPTGWEDILSAAWIDREDRLVQFVLLRDDDDPPFSDNDRELMRLMVCTVAPLIDREMFRRADRGATAGLSQRQADVLDHLLVGMSEKEVASAMHRSVETVHNHVRAIYQRFNVSSRGELMAQFIDRRILEGV